MNYFRNSFSLQSSTAKYGIANIICNVFYAPLWDPVIRGAGSRDESAFETTKKRIRKT
jgi:hypothetical protein